MSALYEPDDLIDRDAPSNHMEACVDAKDTVHERGSRPTPPRQPSKPPASATKGGATLSGRRRSSARRSGQGIEAPALDARDAAPPLRPPGSPAQKLFPPVAAPAPAPGFLDDVASFFSFGGNAGSEGQSRARRAARLALLLNVRQENGPRLPTLQKVSRNGARPAEVRKRRATRRRGLLAKSTARPRRRRDPPPPPGGSSDPPRRTGTTTI